MFYAKTFVILSEKTFDEKSARTSAAKQSGLYFLWTHIRINKYKHFEKIRERIFLAHNISISDSMKQKLNRAK